LWVQPHLRCNPLKRLTRRRTPFPPAALANYPSSSVLPANSSKRYREPPDINAPADSRSVCERAGLLWHGKSLWCQHCFASQIAAAEAEKAKKPRHSLGMNMELSRSGSPYRQIPLSISVVVASLPQKACNGLVGHDCGIVLRDPEGAQLAERDCRLGSHRQVRILRPH